VFGEWHGKNPRDVRQVTSPEEKLGIRGLLFFGFFFKISNAIEEKALEEHNTFGVFRLLHALHSAPQRS